MSNEVISEGPFRTPAESTDKLVSEPSLIPVEVRRWLAKPDTGRSMKIGSVQVENKKPDARYFYETKFIVTIGIGEVSAVAASVNLSHAIQQAFNAYLRLVT